MPDSGLVSVQIEWRCAYCPAVVQQRFSVVDPALMTIPALPTDWLRIGGRAICPVHDLRVLLQVFTNGGWRERVLQQRGSRPAREPMPERTDEEWTPERCL